MSLCGKVTKRMNAFERRAKAAKAALGAVTGLLQSMDGVVSQLTAQPLSSYFVDEAGTSFEIPGESLAGNTGLAGTAAGFVGGLASRLGLDATALSETIFRASGTLPKSDEGDAHAPEAMLKAALAGARIDVSSLRDALLLGSARVQAQLAAQLHQRDSSAGEGDDPPSSGLPGASSSTYYYQGSPGDAFGGDHEDSVMDLQSRLASSSVQLRRLQSEMGSVQRSHEEVVRELEDTVFGLQQELSAARAISAAAASGQPSAAAAGVGDSELESAAPRSPQSPRLNGSSHGASHLYHAHQSDLSEDSDDVDGLRRRLLALEGQILLLGRRLADAQAAAEAAAVRAEAAAHSLDSERSVTAALRSQAATASASLVEARSSIASLEQSLQDAKRSASAAESRALAAEEAATHGAHASEVAELQSRINSLTAALSGAERAQMHAEGDAQSLQAQIDALRSDLATRSARARAMVTEKDKEIAKLTAKLRAAGGSGPPASVPIEGVAPAGIGSPARGSGPAAATPLHRHPSSSSDGAVLAPATPTNNSNSHTNTAGPSPAAVNNGAFTAAPSPSIDGAAATSAAAAAANAAALDDELSDVSRLLELSRAQEAALKAEIRRLEHAVEASRSREASLSSQLEGALAIGSEYVHVEYLRNVSGLKGPGERCEHAVLKHYHLLVNCPLAYHSTQPHLSNPYMLAGRDSVHRLRKRLDGIRAAPRHGERAGDSAAVHARSAEEGRGCARCPRPGRGATSAHPAAAAAAPLRPVRLS